MPDVPKKAVPVGTVAGVQLAPVLKSPEPGLASQVASCAWDGVAGRIQTNASADDVNTAARRRRVAAK